MESFESFCQGFYYFKTLSQIFSIPLRAFHSSIKTHTFSIKMLSNSLHKHNEQSQYFLDGTWPIKAHANVERKIWMNGRCMYAIQIVQNGANFCWGGAQEAAVSNGKSRIRLYVTLGLTGRPATWQAEAVLTSLGGNIFPRGNWINSTLLVRRHRFAHCS